MSANPRFLDSSPSVARILGGEALPGHINPDQCALAWDDQERTYAELRRRVLGLAGALRARGLEAGDRVAGHLLNRGETFELYFACAYAGLTFVSLSWRLTAHELGMILDDADPRIVVTQETVHEHIRAAAEGRDLEIIVLADDGSASAYEQMATGPELDGPFGRTNPHLILYTSGTTGRPKGVMMTHENITWFALQQIALYPKIDQTAVTLVTCPTFNTGGINEQVIPTFLAGGTVTIFPSRNWQPRTMSDAVDRWHVTDTVLFPTMMQNLLAEDENETIGFESLRCVATGGENCPPAILGRFQERWPNAVIYMGYGSTESGLVTQIAGDELLNHPGSVGRTAIGMAVRIQDADGIPVQSGEVGEIWASGGSIVPGYWNAPELTADVVVDGWLNTGDLGWHDENGYLYLAGRSRDLVISKGQNIYPAEVENAISEHEDVLETAVIGLPDAEWGEIVCAAVVLKPERQLTAEQLLEFLQARLASYKKPRGIVFLDVLPRTRAEKVVKADLTAILSKALGRDAS